ncbi:FliM/FliN family flagellar motor C-terminal domain-containing protein [Burkholderia sp. AU31624]|uniref:FliM/FliN family flagellar motor C-terminal domain-containing protein n=1 Tax=Burkholderia sp. AU31624 TaxID=2879629 RepID=UPI001CF1F9A0|nr:FliM/FliN family flagellar motor C-terminal domain-containing protein [Burkholderia sp. AU31624]MCA8254351.1 FliM/FliN family flagellar motor C-terminal domain-containing protein [Burkholderia sp. AU31624]
MSEAPLRWRPLAERDLLEAGTLSESAIAPWLRNWCDDTPRVDDVERIAPLRPPPWSSDAHVWSCGPHLHWAIEPRSLDRLALRALDLEPANGFAATRVDYCAEIVRAFGKSMADDLAAALRAVCGASPPDARHLPQSVAAKPIASRYGAVHVRLALGSDAPCLSIVFAAPFWWARHAPRHASTARNAPLTPRTAAIESIGTHVHARLGIVALPVAQLLDLTPGDVLVLADRLDPDISVTTGHPGQIAVGFGRLGRTDGQLSIQLQSLVEPEDHR